MESILIPPAEYSLFGVVPLWIFALVIPAAAVGLFAYIIANRMRPLVLAQKDVRWDQLPLRAWYTLKYAFAQYKQPRYFKAGVIHIIIFAGFMIISLHSMMLVAQGVKAGYVLPFLVSPLHEMYVVAKEFVATAVLICCVIAAVRRKFFPEDRWRVPEGRGKDHTPEAILILAMISGLMLCDMLFEGSEAAAAIQAGHKPHLLIPFTGTWVVTHLVLRFLPKEALQAIHLVFYYGHELIFFSFLNVLPLGKHFHVFISIPNVFFAKLTKGTIKPVRWGLTDKELEDLESVGVKKITDFTWKHIFDFMSCADCGRCSDQCPANAVGRPLSPRFVTTKCRDHVYAVFPLKGERKPNGDIIGDVLDADEIWSCTTCGACENECPILIEYIDKMVDLRRGMVDAGEVPQSLQKPLSALEKRGNPWGKMEKKRAEWALAIKDEVPVTVVDPKKGGTCETLYFVDSITSFDDQINRIAQSTARVMYAAGDQVCVLGPAEKDSGHEVRRFGEETLFNVLKEDNTAAIEASGAKKIVTADPHAYNALKKDYKGLPPVEHVAEYILAALKAGKITLKPEESGKTYVYHDPCYLGRHNDLYDAPRQVLDAVPGLKRAEMERSRDRSFCCGGGGLMLFYEPIEETRMGKLRVEMAAAAGAEVIVTACPFCKVNIEDGIKTSGNEGKIECLDLVELVARQLA
jgi:Fe-S oxidoreductase